MYVYTEYTIHSTHVCVFRVWPTQLSICALLLNLLYPIHKSEFHITYLELNQVKQHFHGDHCGVKVKLCSLFIVATPPFMKSESGKLSVAAHAEFVYQTKPKWENSWWWAHCKRTSRVCPPKQNQRIKTSWWFERTGRAAPLYCSQVHQIFLLPRLILPIWEADSLCWNNFFLHIAFHPTPSFCTKIHFRIKNLKAVGHSFQKIYHVYGRSVTVQNTDTVGVTDGPINQLTYWLGKVMNLAIIA